MYFRLVFVLKMMQFYLENDIFTLYLHINYNVVSKIKLYYVAFSCWLLASCQSSTDHQSPQRQLHFKTEVLLKTTPVKNQGRSSLCWIYTMLATIETEHLMQGDSVNLSTDFVARHFLEEQAMEGNHNITTRGTLPMALQLLQTYGLTHYDAYHSMESKVSYHQLCRELEQVCLSPVIMLTDRSKRAAEVLDEVLGPMPRHVFMLGAEYTAQEFAHSVCRTDEYRAYTSFTHHPYYQAFPLEVPDNRYHNTFINLPLDTLMARIDRSLRNGHPVAWEGDISEKEFRWAEGVAGPLSNHPQGGGLEGVTAKRQQAFERGLTTDDHCMEIVGIARMVASPRGGSMEEATKYYIMKNSWGTDNAYRGFMLVSEDYVRMKTIAVVMRNEG